MSRADSRTCPQPSAAVGAPPSTVAVDHEDPGGYQTLVFGSVMAPTSPSPPPRFSSAAPTGPTPELTPPISPETTMVVTEGSPAPPVLYGQWGPSLASPASSVSSLYPPAPLGHPVAYAPVPGGEPPIRESSIQISQSESISLSQVSSTLLPRRSFSWLGVRPTSLLSCSDGRCSLALGFCPSQPGVCSSASRSSRPAGSSFAVLPSGHTRMAHAVHGACLPSSTVPRRAALDHPSSFVSTTRSASRRRRLPTSRWSSPSPTCSPPTASPTQLLPKYTGLLRTWTAGAAVPAACRGTLRFRTRLPHGSSVSDQPNAHGRGRSCVLWRPTRDRRVVRSSSSS